VWDKEIAKDHISCTCIRLFNVAVLIVHHADPHFIDKLFLDIYPNAPTFSDPKIFL